MKRSFDILLCLFALSMCVTCGKEDNSEKEQQQGQEAILSVSQTALSFDNNGGEKTVEVTASRFFSISSNVSWCKASPSSGDGSKNHQQYISISCEPNNDAEKRTGTVTVTSGNKSASVTVTQDEGKALRLSQTEFNISNEAQTVSIEVLSNVNFEVLIDDACKTWISHDYTKSLASKLVTLSIAKNDEYDDREGKIVIKETNGSLSGIVSVKQSKKNGLFVTTSEYNLNNDAHTLTVEVQANVEFDVVSHASWIKHTETKGLKTSQITLQIEANNTYDERIGTVTVNQRDGEMSGDIIIKQDSNYGIYFPAFTWGYFSAQAQSIDIEVVCNYEYDIIIPDACSDWMSLSETKALTSHFYTVTLTENTSYEDRDGSITFKQKDGAGSGTVRITQYGKKGLFIVTPEYHISNEKQTLAVEIQHNVLTRVESNASWIKYIETKGLTSSQVVLDVDENVTDEERVGTVTVKQLDGDLSGTITIKQDGSYELFVTQSEYILTSSAQSIDVEVKYNVDYEIVIPDACKGWITPVETKSLSSNHHMFSISENTTDDERRGSITFKQKDGALSGSVSIIQKQNEGIVAEKTQYDVTPDAQQLDIKIKSNVDYSVVIDDNCKSWLSIIETKALKESVVSLSIAKNEGEDRVGYVYIIYDNVTETITISQPASIIVFKDGVFRKICVDKYDSNKDGEVSFSEVATIRTMDISNMGIASIDEIRYFRGLNVLKCDHNQLTHLDVSMSPDLRQLDCSNNQLSSLSIDGNGQPTFLGVVSNATFLNCSYNKLTSLTLKETNRYYSIDCRNNSLTQLDVSGCTDLIVLDCSNNSLTKLDLSNAASVSELNCSNNSLTKLDVSSTASMSQLDCSNNQLQTISFEDGSSIHTFNCDNNQLSSITIGICRVLYSSNNPLTSIKGSIHEKIICRNNRSASLDISQIKNLGYLDCQESPSLTTVIADGSVNVIHDETTKVTYLNIIVFPDKNFEKASLRSADMNRNGVITIEEIQATGYLDVSNGNIVSLDGIEYFTSLKSFNCSNNQITSIDLSNNPQLESLNCANNQITSIDLSNNPLLESLYCSNNQIKEFHLNNNPLLKYFDCSNNSLSSLALNPNPNIQTLVCDNNALESLVIKNYTSLTSLSCESNNITYLDISHNNALLKLKIGNNPINSFDISGNFRLQYFDCRNCGLTSLENLSIYTELTTLDCSNNSLSSLDLKKSKVAYLNCTSNPELNEVWISYEDNRKYTLVYDSNTSIIRFDSNGELVEMVKFTDNTFKELCVKDYDINTDGDISPHEALAVQAIDCSFKQIHSLEGINCFTNLVTLDCSYNLLTNLDVSGCRSLSGLDFQNNPLKRINVSGCESLTGLWCSEMGIEQLEVSGCSSMKELRCINNQITNLDLSGCTSLRYLSCEHNQLTSLVLCKDTWMKEVNCSYNKLTSLELNKGNKTYYKIDCSHNQLTTIDLSDNIMEIVYCNDNQLTSINLRGFQVSDFDCSRNKLESLDLNECYIGELFVCSNNKLTNLVLTDAQSTIKYLSCDNNPLSLLNISKAERLQELYCDDAPLENIVIGNHQYLIEINCENTLLTSLDVSGCANKMRNLLCSNNPYLKTLYMKRGQTVSNAFRYDKSITTIVYKD